MLIKGEPNVAYICSRYYRAPELVFEATEYTTAIGTAFLLLSSTSLLLYLSPSLLLSFSCTDIPYQILPQCE